MLVCGDDRRTYGEVRRPAPGAGRLLAATGPRAPASVDRADLERWECGQAPVALVMHNRPEYVESMLGCYRARAVPFNVNHHYNAGRGRRRCSTMIGAAAVVYQRPLGPLVAARAIATDVVLDRRRRRLRRRAARRAASPTRTPIATRGDGACPTPSPRRPLPGLHRRHHRPAQGRAVAPGRHLRGRHGRHRGAPRPSRSPTGAAATRRPWFAAPPLMHAAAQWTAFCGLHAGRHHRPARRRRAASTPRTILRDRRARAGEPDLDRRRRLRPPARRRAAARALRPRRRCRRIGTGGAIDQPSTTRRRCSSCCPTS